MSCEAGLPNESLLHPISQAVHYILTGTFNTIFLYILAFNPSTSSLKVHAKIAAEGPHEYIGLNAEGTKAYATTWALPPSLSAWNVSQGGRGGIQHINTVPITATSSYVQVSPYLPRVYSAGGPTGEVHAIDSETGGLGEKLQQLLYVEPENLAEADKTRVALRYGSHGIDLNVPRKQVFVPHLGHNSIFMYNISEEGILELVAECPSFEEHDGPRHVIPSADGSKLYAVTEHNSYVDVYSIGKKSLHHLQRISIIPPELESNRENFRGDTLRLSKSGEFLYATTRGKTSETRGWLAVWLVAEDGTLGEAIDSQPDFLGGEWQAVDNFAPITRWETPTSGGKANALDIFPFQQIEQDFDEDGEAVVEILEWILLTDDELGFVWVLEFDGDNLKELASVNLRFGAENDEEPNPGASHAVWLS